MSGTKTALDELIEEHRPEPTAPPRSAVLPYLTVADARSAITGMLMRSEPPPSASQLSWTTVELGMRSLPLPAAYSTWPTSIRRSGCGHRFRVPLR